MAPEENVLLTKHTEQYADAYATGVLDPVAHRRLVQNLEKYSHQAGIQPRFVYTRLAKYLTNPGEIEWAVKLRSRAEEGIAGLCYIGIKDVEDRVQSIAGLCLRNATDARVIVVGQVLQRIREGELGFPTVLLIPNFAMPGITSWQAAQLTDVLLARYQRGLQTVIYCKDLEQLAALYDEMLVAHIKKHYVKIDY